MEELGSPCPSFGGLPPPPLGWKLPEFGAPGLISMADLESLMDHAAFQSPADQA